MKRSEIAISVGLVPLDYLMVVLAGLAAYGLRYWDLIAQIRPVIFALDFSSFLQLVMLVAPLWTISFALAGLYSMDSTRRTIDELSKIFLACSTAMMALMFIFFLSRNLFDSRFIIVVGWVFSIIFIIIGRGIIRLVQQQGYRYGVGVHRLALIGAGQLSQNVIQSFAQHPRAGYRVTEQFVDFTQRDEGYLAAMIQNDQVDELLVISPNLGEDALMRLHDFSYVNHVPLKFIADIFDFPLTNFEIDEVAGLPIIEIKKTRLDGWGRVYKRIFDIVGSLVLIVIFSPLMLLTAIAIKIDSSGPLLFTYRRIGEGGRPFVYFKFRSMVPDAHEYRFDPNFVKKQKNLRAGTPMMKFQSDPRVTRVGKFIRKYSIDELPELFNVLSGRMSLVGPRPHEIEEVNKYQTHHRKVLTIKPGITGMAQVSGRSDLDFEEEVRLDTWYIEHWSLKLDFMILFKTPWAVVKKRGAE